MKKNKTLEIFKCVMDDSLFVDNLQLFTIVKYALEHSYLNKLTAK